MKKVFAVIAVAVACVFAQTDRTTATMMANIIQPTRHIDGSTIDFGATGYTFPSGRWAKAAELKTGSTSGYVKVHLIGDAPSSRYMMPLTATGRTAGMFDVVDSTGSTVVLDSVQFFLNEPY